MASTRRAVIDVGTNSVKLLVADVEEHSVSPVVEESDQTRLGRGFYETHQLQRDAISDTAGAVARFAQVAQANRATDIRVIATSATRDALNRQQLLDAIRERSGLTVEVISGEQEAEWVYQGVCTDRSLARQRLLILDVGGGSSEFIIGENDHPEFSRSFPVGSVRLLELIRPSDPPRPDELQRCRDWLKKFFAEKIRPVIEPVLNAHDGHHRPQLIGTGGTATILARMEYALEGYRRHEIEGACISAKSIEAWTRKLWSLSLDERRKIVGLPRKRADVILTGIAVYDAVLREFGFGELRASTRGLRFAAVRSSVPSV